MACIHCGKLFLKEDHRWITTKGDMCNTCYKRITSNVIRGLDKESDNKELESPSYYKEGGIQPIEYMKMKMSQEMYEGFLLGNVIKYVSRYKGKNGLEDLRKARWYLSQLIFEEENKDSE